MFLGSALLALVTLLALYAIHQFLHLWRFVKRVEKLPTTKTIPLLGHAHKFLVPRNKILEVIIEMVSEEKEMFTIWLGPIPILAVFSPRLFELILGSQKHIDKATQYQFLEPWLGTGLLTSTGQKWQSHRKMLTPAFHFSILDNFVDVFAEKSQILIKKLEKETTSEDFDIFPFISRCTLDIICETAMGVSINAQNVDQKSEYIESVCGITNEVMRRMLMPWLYPDFIYYLTPGGRRTKKYINVLHSFTNKVIRERKAHFKRRNTLNAEDDVFVPGLKKKLAFLDILLDASENGSKLTDEEIREEVDTFMFEGHDTTAASISWLLFLLGSRPSIQEKIYEELFGIFNGSDRTPTTKDLNEMKYLERAIKEGLRRYPSVPAIARVLKEDIEYDGHTIPAGMRVALLVGFVHHNIEQYNESEILGFDPDNFLPERIAERHPYSYVPFSAGPRNCIGQKFALLEEKMILSSIVRNYKWEIVGEEPEPLPELILRPENGIHLKLTKRDRQL